LSIINSEQSIVDSFTEHFLCDALTVFLFFVILAVQYVKLLLSSVNCIVWSFCLNKSWWQSQSF